MGRASLISHHNSCLD